MKAYLLDTTAVSDWFDETRPRHDAVSEKVAQCARAEALLLTSTVVLGEIEYGIQVAPAHKKASLDALRAQVDVQFVHRRLLLDVRRSTALVYGDLKARLFEKYAPHDQRTKKRRVEQLTDPVTCMSLGIQENDLWIAAQAIERNFVLVSSDAMNRIGSVVDPEELSVEDWGKP